MLPVFMEVQAGESEGSSAVCAFPAPADCRLHTIDWNLQERSDRRITFVASNGSVLRGEFEVEIELLVDGSRLHAAKDRMCWCRKHRSDVEDFELTVFSSVAAAKELHERFNRFRSFRACCPMK